MSTVETGKKRRNPYSINYTPSPTIRRMLLADPNETPWINIMGPIGGGKSVGCMMKLMREAILQPPHPYDNTRYTRFAIVRNTDQQLRDTTMKTVFDWIVPDGPLAEWKATDKTLVLRFKLEDGTLMHSEWMFRALDKPDDVRRLLSMELTGAWCNELREFNQQIYDAVFSRTGRYPAVEEDDETGEIIYQCYRRFVLGDTNPPSEGSWLYKEWEENTNPRVALFKQPSARSPEAENTRYLHPRYYLDLIEKHGEDSDFVRMYVDGQYGKRLAGTAVYEKNFNYELHTRPDAELRRRLAKANSVMGAPAPVIIGLDFGRTPSAIIGPVTDTGQLLVLDEIITENMDFRTFLEQKLIPLLRWKYKGHPVACVGDPAGSAKSDNDSLNKFHILEEFGLYGEPASTYGKPDNTPDARLGAVNRFLTALVGGEPKILYSREGVPTLIDGFRFGYRYKEKKDEEAAPDTPLKNKYSHPHDAHQYQCMGVLDGVDGRRMELYMLEDNDEDDASSINNQGRSAVTGY